MSFSIRPCTLEDIPGMHSLIMELAVYEKAPQEVKVSVEEFKHNFKSNLFRAFVAEEKGEIVGMALYYIAYSTWKGKMIYLDDLVVTESKRKSGIGKKLFNSLIGVCKKEGINQLRWHVLDWNEPAIQFYHKIKANLDSEWIQCKLERMDIENFKTD